MADGAYQRLIAEVSRLSAAEPVDRAAVESALARIRGLIERLDFGRMKDLRFDWSRDAGRGGVYIRGVNNAENPPQQPGLGSGTMLTQPHITTQEHFWQFVRHALASTWSSEAFWERQRFAIDPATVHPAVWLVPTQRVRYSFMIHTSRTSIGAPGELVIELAQGQGEALVSRDPAFAGHAPSRVVWDKGRGRAVSRTPSAKPMRVTLSSEGVWREPTVPEEEFLRQPDAGRLEAALAELAGQVERAMGGPQEIEGGLIPGPNPGEWTIVLLQTRPSARRAHIVE